VVAISDPFSGGFIANAHYWHKGIPWIQIEVNRSLYERLPADPGSLPASPVRVHELREKIWKIITELWDGNR